AHLRGASDHEPERIAPRTPWPSLQRPCRADRFTDALSGLFDYAIAEVGGPWSVDDSCEFQFDPVGAKVVEEPAALTEQYWDQVNLDLIEDARGESELRRSSPMHQHVLVAGGFLGALSR